MEKVNYNIENILPDTMFRPKTIKDLVQSLKNGIKCELPSSAFDRTNYNLDGGLLFKDKYITYLSENTGWVIYEPIN